jgi:hypothetical protein
MGCPAEVDRRAARSGWVTHSQAESGCDSFRSAAWGRGNSVRVAELDSAKAR